MANLSFLGFLSLTFRPRKLHICMYTHTHTHTHWTPLSSDICIVYNLYIHIRIYMYNVCLELNSLNLISVDHNLEEQKCFRDQCDMPNTYCVKSHQHLWLKKQFANGILNEVQPLLFESERVFFMYCHLPEFQVSLILILDQYCPIQNVMKATNVSYICNLKFSSRVLKEVKRNCQNAF